MTGCRVKSVLGFYFCNRHMCIVSIMEDYKACLELKNIALASLLYVNESHIEGVSGRGSGGAGVGGGWCVSRNTVSICISKDLLHILD